VTMKHFKKYVASPGSETAKRSGSIASYVPKGGLPKSSTSSQRQTAATSRSRRRGTAAGTVKMGRSLRAINRRQRRV
jgi:hypothetical protein